MNNRYMGMTPGQNLMAVQRPVGGVNMQMQQHQLLKASYISMPTGNLKDYSKEEKVEMGALAMKVGLSTVLAYKTGRALGAAAAKPPKQVEPTDQQRLNKNMGELKSGL